ncbi:amidase [Corticibacter populi]|uniref:Amidase n=1 Tax=Corticibacter populi TaxID=1550736 RepID=A0A3M6QX54_9BURK|nr:amidase [Corticibacter populi]RMX07596.1 amidase [Corticibacter populi]RZS30094.1 Asp-tRNA(Asn)/Glu-tRNA(Gln) amidotransferase A subunit family amidase [Corticibacter populi]
MHTSTFLLNAGAAQLTRRLQSRDIQATTVVHACLERIAEREPALQAWTHVAADAALARARALDDSPIQGLLHGLPLGIKDIFDTWDMPTGYGSPIYAGHQPAADAASVALCREAGAVLLGKTVTTEFATFQAGPTRNPHNQAHTPGGSSSGSCAAVAASMVPLAFGSQTAASIIRPAAYCGVVGYKPSFGAIGRAGVKGLSDSLDTIGAIGREVEDVALLAACLSGNQRLLDLSFHHAPRVGLCRTAAWDSVAAETKATMAMVPAALEKAGATVVDVELPAGFASLPQAHIDIMAYEAARTLSDERLRHGQQLSAGLRGVIERGLQMPHAEYVAQLQLAAWARAQLPAIFENVDVLLAPSAAGEAPLFEEGTGDPQYCRAWTLLGLPCVHLPFARGPHGLPVGLQAVGKLHADHATLAAAAWLLPRLRQA